MPKIVVVDDEPANTHLLKMALKSDYEIHCFSSAKECLQKAPDLNPDVFLLDVRMPEMDGFELCRELRTKAQFKSSHIMFISALDSLDQKIKGYNAGADDYITKPIELPELIAKLQPLISKLVATQQNTDNAMSVAMTAMSQSSEMGLVNQFFERLQECSNFSEIGQSVVNISKEFEINAAVQLRVNSRLFHGSTTGHVSPLEKELMSQAQYSDRILTFGSRCLFNFASATLLVRRMSDDEEKTGRLRDHLASVMGGVDARVAALKTELAYHVQSEQAVTKALENTHDTLTHILAGFKSHESSVTQIMEHLVDDMNLAFAYLDLDGEQESYLMNIFNGKLEDLSNLFSKSVELDRKFEETMSDLHTILNPTETTKK